MREFFIKSLEMIVNIVVVIGALVVVGIAAAMLLGGGHMGPGGEQMPGGPVAALFVLIGGAAYLLFVGGFMYMAIGIYHNTRRAAEALEKMAGR